MPAGRRSSVRFNLEPVEEAPAPARATRATRASAEQQQHAVPPSSSSSDATAAAAPAAARATRGRKAAAPIERDGGFQFKRMKTTKTASAAPPAAAAAAAPPPPSAQQQQQQQQQQQVPNAAPAPAATTARAATAPNATAAPAAPPSVLAGCDPAVLHALFDVCTAAAQQSSDAKAALPDLDLALSACFGELRRQGVTQAAPANPAVAALRARCADLDTNVADVRAAIAAWDQAAKQAPPPQYAHASVAASASSSSASSSSSVAADTRLIASLPDLPDLEGQLAELGTLAGLCAEQVEAASRQVLSTVTNAEGERLRLERAAHKQTFKGYLDIDEPRALVRGLLA